MERELEAATRKERLYAEMVSIVRLVARLNTSYCMFCGIPRVLGHDHGCPVTRARRLLAALDTPEERAARYSRPSEVQ